MKTLLETKRLLMRPLSMGELSCIADGVLSAAAEYIEPDAITETVITAAIKKTEKMRNADPTLHELYTYWLIVDKESGQGIGFIGFKGYDKDGCLEVGYNISPGYRKKRLMTEALEALIKWAFENKGVKGITAKVNKTNTGSVRVLNNCNFEQVGHSETELFYCLKSSKKQKA